MNPGPTARVKSCCALIATLTLVGCTTVQKPKPPPTQESIPAVVDAPESTSTQRIDIANKDVVVDKTQSPEKPGPAVQKSSEDAAASNEVEPATSKVETRPQIYNLPKPLIVDKILRTGNLENTQLTEVSGMVASRNSPGVLYAINDSGDSATLYALGEKGQHIAQWSIKARNKDWEDLDSIELNNQNYILIGDTGDNLRINRKGTFYLIAEPLPAWQPDQSLVPYMTIDFVYEDGPRNVEAFAVFGTTIYLVSKEPLSSLGATASRLYALQIPPAQPANTLTAKFLTELPKPRASFESKLAASFVGVDLDHVTAMDMTASGRSAYLLTYRQVQKIDRAADESWSTAFQRRGKRIHTHNLGQAEALAIAPGRSVFVTAERRGAPLLSIPIQTAP